MRKERILAVIMSVLMALSMLPITVFAAETTTLNGKLKIQGIAAEGKTLSADFKNVDTEGLTEDDVTYLWSRKTFDDEAAENAGETPQLKELGKEKTYTVTKEDIGSKIVLTITGKEEKGYSGTLTVTSDEVVDAESGAALETAAEAQTEDASEETGEDQTTDEENTNDHQDNADSTEDTEAAGAETVDEIPPATSDAQQTEPQEEQSEQTGETQEVPAEDTLVKDGQMEDDQSVQADASIAGEDKAGTEAVGGIPPATSDDTYPAENENNGTTEDPSNEDPSNEDPSNEDPSNEDPSNENPSQVTADQIKIGENDSLTPTFSFVQDYTTDDATAAQKTITFTNNSSDTAVDLSVTASGDANQAAMAVWAEQTDAQTNTVTVNPGASATLTITPVTGLDANANPYQQTFTVNNVNDPAAMMEIATITATVTVQGISHDLTPNPNETLDFATAKNGYSAVDAKTITYTNNGNIPETVIMPVSQSGNYEITTEDSLKLAPNGEGRITFSVRPKAGLAVGSYTETIKVATESGFEATTPISVAFQVIKDTATLTKIQQPSAVSGLPNGTKKSASSLKLPSAVVIETTAGNMKAAVSWNVKGASYRQSATDEQNFSVSGTLTLPDGVDNDNNLNLATSIDVNVKAYSPKIASAENNTITGIDYNGVYTTQSKISFTAVGAGMDNTSPRKGDTRYKPKSWTVLNNTLGWDAAPYTASFGLAKSGDYTLKVNFEQQKYDGNSWQPTNTTDTRQVSFSITKANVTAPGADLTPAISKTGAVKTGDSTQILPFICILIIAAGAIGGVVFYKKKNKNK
ncbi:Uncharacterised protein [uncultured Ruminococcus sp.]|nr:Uncharacterised protein [uncultured Ruminococcus sp.]